jgi:hypothetical protein
MGDSSRKGRGSGTTVEGTVSPQAGRLASQQGSGDDPWLGALGAGSVRQGKPVGSHVPRRVARGAWWVGSGLRAGCDWRKPHMARSRSSGIQRLALRILASTLFASLLAKRSEGMTGRPMRACYGRSLTRELVTESCRPPSRAGGGNNGSVWPVAGHRRYGRIGTARPRHKIAQRRGHRSVPQRRQVPGQN